MKTAATWTPYEQMAVVILYRNLLNPNPKFEGVALHQVVHEDKGTRSPQGSLANPMAVDLKNNVEGSLCREWPLSAAKASFAEIAPMRVGVLPVWFEQIDLCAVTDTHGGDRLQSGGLGWASIKSITDKN